MAGNAVCISSQRPRDLSITPSKYKGGVKGLKAGYRFTKPALSGNWMTLLGDFAKAKNGQFKSNLRSSTTPAS